jgi:multidrug efflux pump subunit AcrA (membrane-fusion protein)
MPASLSQETRRLTYHLRIGDPDLPNAGTPLEVRVPLPPGIVVPQDAVQQIEGEWGVFAVDDERARFVPIRRGPELGGDVIVLEGLEPGRRIAVEGAYLLKALTLKRSGGGDEHAH